MYIKINDLNQLIHKAAIYNPVQIFASRRQINIEKNE